MATVIKYLKVYYGYTGSNVKRPYIRLCGKYLTGKDFAVGDTIEVLLESGKIVIQKVNNK